MTTDDPNAQRVHKARQALEAYEAVSFPDSASSLDADPLYKQAMLSAMLCDLEHYAVDNGLDFAEAAKDGRETYADEIAAQNQYAIGDEVQSRLGFTRRGTVFDVSANAAGEPTYLVKVPGLPYVLEDTAVALQAAPPFPPTPNAGASITRADQAEEALVDLATRLRGPHTEETRQTYERVLEALSEWSGSTSYDLLSDLASRIAQRTAERTPPVEPPPDAAELAAHDFPHDITEGIPPDNTANLRPAPTRPDQQHPRRTA